MTTSHSNPLQGLRGLHLPPPVSAWPPAPGWWLLGLLVIALLMGTIWFWRRYRRHAYRRIALKHLQELRAAMQQGQTDTAIIAEISILLRRVAISRYGRQQVAALRGPEWLAFLDRTGRTNAFTCQGRVLLDAPYQRNSGQLAEPILELAQQWLRLQS